MRRVAALVLAITGCGRIAFDARGDGNPGGDAAADAIPALVCGPWGTPVRLDAIDTAEYDWDPALHPLGDILVYGSGFGATTGATQLFVSTRAGTTFGAGSVETVLSPVNNNHDGGPAWSRAGDRLYFRSDRSSTLFHLFVSTYSNGVFGTPTMVPELATEAVNAVAFSPDELEMYYDDDDTSSAPVHLHRAIRASRTSPWVPQGIETQLDVGGEYGWPAIAPDGLTLFYEASPNGNTHLYEARRSSTADRFTSPVMIPDFAGLQQIGDPEISADGQTMLFSADVFGGTTLTDIYMVTRTCN